MLSVERVPYILDSLICVFGHILIFKYLIGNESYLNVVLNNFTMVWLT